LKPISQWANLQCGYCLWSTTNVKLVSSIAVQLSKLSQIAQALLVFVCCCQRSRGHSDLHRLAIVALDRWRWRSNRKWAAI
jgi:hypothetical protein